MKTEKIRIVSHKISKDYGLSKRETEVLFNYACGISSTKEMSEKMLISGKTVERHVFNILSKMGCHSMKKVLSIFISYMC